MGLRGPGAKPLKSTPPKGARTKRASWQRARGRANRVIAFLQSLKLTSGDHAGKRFRLRPWQQRIIRAIYRLHRGRRVVLTALITMARKNGKTQLASALALCHLLGPEAEPRGEVYSAASDRNQAGRVFREMEAMILADPDLAARVNIQRFTKKIEVLAGPGAGSFYEALSSDARKAHSLSPSFVVCDELSQWKGRELYDNLVTGVGARRDPLVIVISTMSNDPNHIMSELVGYGEQVRDGVVKDRSFAPFIFSAPKEADPWDERTWKLANPALGDFRSLDELRKFAQRARLLPSLEAVMRNLYLNQAVDRQEAWITAESWGVCGGPVDLDALEGEECFGGLDLGSVRDLTAFSLFWPGPGALAVWAWCPEEQLRDRTESARVPYALWRKQGYIETTPGKATDKRAVALRLAELNARFHPSAIAFDRWGMPELNRILNEEGIDLPLVEFGQGFKSMAPAMKSFEERVLNGRLIHGDNPLLTWAVSNVVPDIDAAGNSKPNKERARERIDPVVAAIMAVGATSMDMPAGPSVYEQRGILVL